MTMVLRQRRPRKIAVPALLRLLLLLSVWPVCEAFVVTPTAKTLSFSPSSTSLLFHRHQPLRLDTPTKSNGDSPTSLHMYNPPPPLFPPPNNSNPLREVAVGTLVLVGLVAFFASPLGSVVFLALNSLFLLAFLLPVVGWIGFTVWSSFNTIEGPCPNCGAPVRVVKEPGTPNLCITCGSFVQCAPDTKGLELYYSNYGDESSSSVSSLWDSWFGGGDTITTITTTTSTSSPEDRQAQYRRERTIIDVDATQEDDYYDRNRRGRDRQRNNDNSWW